MNELKRFMGIENEKLTDKQVAIIMWAGLSTIAVFILACLLPVMPTWLQFVIGVPVGLNWLVAMLAMPQGGIIVKE